VKAAENVGLDISKGAIQPIEYGGSAASGRRLPVYLEVRGRRLRSEMVFVHRLDFPFVMLGRMGVFPWFNEVAFLERIKAPRVEFRW
jgi:hypothetical protein